jgi:hypothetical protein
MTQTFQITDANKAEPFVTESAINGESRRPVPYVMPSSDRYYWSPRWQSDEAETLADDEGIVFDSDDAEDAAKWLRESADDDE